MLTGSNFDVTLHDLHCFVVGLYRDWGQTERGREGKAAQKKGFVSCELGTCQHYKLI